MSYICLGWGSLIWRPEDLPLVNKRPDAWREDGPELPVEFLRQSNNGCLTLVIDRNSPQSRVLWNELSVDSLSAAIEALRQREGNTRSSWIGRWPQGDEFECADIVDRWARPRGFSGVVWAAMPAKHDEKDGLRPTQNEAIAYLKALEGDQFDLAEEYVRRAPKQIDTPYRRAIVDELGWHSIQ